MIFKRAFVVLSLIAGLSFSLSAGEQAPVARPAVFTAALVTRNWLFVALLAVPGIVTLALLVRATVQVARSRR